jgi:hypothetical protein
MTQREDTSMDCPACGLAIDRGDRFCRRCGLRQTTDAAGNPWLPVPAELATPPSPRRNWSEDRTVVLVMLFAALGPLALPMLWRSRQFSLTAKIVLTLTVVAVTVFVVWVLWYAVNTMLAPLRDLPGFAK